MTIGVQCLTTIRYGEQVIGGGGQFISTECNRTDTLIEGQLGMRGKRWFSEEPHMTQIIQGDNRLNVLFKLALWATLLRYFCVTHNKSHW